MSYSEKDFIFVKSDIEVERRRRRNKRMADENSRDVGLTAKEKWKES